MQETKSIFCKKRYDAHILDDFKRIYIVKTGHVFKDSDTTYYSIIFEFEDGVKMETIYDKNIRDIKKKYADILIYLKKTEGVNFSDIKYRD